MDELPKFIKFSSIPRLSRPCIITEKIDGTNCVIYIHDDFIIAGSRSKWISEEEDHFGFAAWVNRNKEELLKLGNGYHWGEWWGNGIQRKYDLKVNKFSLFDTNKYSKLVLPKCVDVVPILGTVDFNTFEIMDIFLSLAANGSVCAPGYLNPEGIVIKHIQSGHMYKKTYDNDEYVVSK